MLLDHIQYSRFVAYSKLAPTPALILPSCRINRKFNNSIIISICYYYSSNNSLVSSNKNQFGLLPVHKSVTIPYISIFENPPSCVIYNSPSSLLHINMIFRIRKIVMKFSNRTFHIKLYIFC